MMNGEGKRTGKSSTLTLQKGFLRLIYVGTDASPCRFVFGTVFRQKGWRTSWNDPAKTFRAKHNQSFVTVTHNKELAARADRIITMVDGKIAT